MTAFGAGNCGNLTVARAGIGAAHDTAERGLTGTSIARTLHERALAIYETRLGTDYPAPPTAGRRLRRWWLD